MMNPDEIADEVALDNWMFEVAKPVIELLGVKLVVMDAPNTNEMTWNIKYVRISDEWTYRYSWSTGELLLWEFIVSLTGMCTLEVWRILERVDRENRRVIAEAFTKYMTH